MGTTAKPRRANRSITIDFRDEAPYFRPMEDGKAFLEYVLAFLLSLGLHGPATFRLALSLDAARSGS